MVKRESLRESARAHLLTMRHGKIGDECNDSIKMIRVSVFAFHDHMFGIQLHLDLYEHIPHSSPITCLTQVLQPSGQDES